MKKLFFALAFALVAVMGQARTYNYDVNKDGVVSVTDVTFLVNYILGVPNLMEEQQSYTYDVNGDGMVNVTDVTCLVDKILGIVNPGEEPPSYLTCPDENHPHFIDLGLPSGTKWACCNMGANAPEAYGGYYGWGETEVTDVYSWDNYVCGLDDSYDGNDIAGTQYDVAHVKWGGLWVMPSEDQINELLSKCHQSRGENGGWVFTASNGGTIILPGAGYRLGKDRSDEGKCYYWTSTAVPNSWVSRFYKGNSFGQQYRCWGYSIRPVVCPEK